MPEELLIRHCSPTLAGMKTGNMFTCSFEDEEDMKESIREMNKILGRKGLRVLPLRVRDGRTLIYVYRPAMLARDLRHETACRLLQDCGYRADSAGQCIMHLMRRLSGSEEFPHEIGLFLGYPPEDVCGFIEKGAESCKCSGIWKVYGDEEKARKTFEKFHKCTRAYCMQLKKGKSIERLALAVPS